MPRNPTRRESNAHSESWLSVPRLPSLFRMRHRRRTSPGERPGSVVADPEAPRPQISVIQYDGESYDEQTDVTVAHLSDFVRPDIVTWVNIDGLGDADIITAIGEIFGLHGLVQEDIINVHQRPKVEEYDDHLFIVARMVSLDQHLQAEQISLILGENFLLTFQERSGDCLGPVRHRLRKAVGRIRNAGVDYLSYAVLDAIIDGYFPVINSYNEQLDTMEEQLSLHPSRHVIARIHQLRSELYVLRKAIWPHRELFNALLRDTGGYFHEETRVYLRDCYDHTIQIIDVVETSREITSDIRDFYFTQVSIKQNEIMKVLTIISSVFIPLSFVAGLYGMNFDSDVSQYNMPELHWFYGYPMALGIMLTIALGMVVYFWKRGWLSR